MFLQFRGIIAKEHGARRLYALPTVVALLITAPIAIADNRMIVDDLGFKIQIKDDIRRVVSLVPTNSEMVCLLDCGRLAGGTRHDQFPEELRKRIKLKQVEDIGGGFDANLEKIVRLQPDLILTNGPTQQRFAVPLKNMGYSVMSLWPRDMAGLKKENILQRSNDGGKNWNAVVTIPVSDDPLPGGLVYGGGGFDNVHQLSDGSLLHNMRSYHKKNRRAWRCLSRDLDTRGQNQKEKQSECYFSSIGHTIRSPTSGERIRRMRRARTIPIGAKRRAGSAGRSP
jgi:hypothetical protein